MKHIQVLVRTMVVAALFTSLVTAPASAQGTTFYACYVPSVGAMYLIKLAGLPQSCLSGAHQQISWTEGGAAADGSITTAKLADGAVTTAKLAAGAFDHGATSGLTDDDHPQYIPVSGARTGSTGFAISGDLGAGTIPATGPGLRMMFWPAMAAFRSGTALGGEWDAGSVGGSSVAMGYGTMASGSYSAAMGERTTASGQSSTATGSNTTASNFASTAMGNRTTASGSGSTAMGSHTTASGGYSTAMGYFTTASGNYTTAMGTYASTNGHRGSFVYGDASTTSYVDVSGDNQFVVRAAGGTFFYSNSAASVGVRLAPGAGAWATLSSRTRKHLFRNEDGEDALARIAALPIQSWSYKTQNDGIRHLGPTAQDFYASFKLGESDSTITTTDIDGVTLLATQALEARTRTAQIDLIDLRTLVARQNKELVLLRNRLAQLEEELAKRHQ